jgi:hypothetical protein
MGYKLDPAVVIEVRRVFSPQDIDYVLAKLTETPPPVALVGPPSRIHLAVIWLSKGDRKKFDCEIDGTRRDWRDTLVTAGLDGEGWREIIMSRGIDCSNW